MRKYLTVFAIDWQNQFIYRLNFVLWRFRNVLRVLMTYFLWTSIFSSNTAVFGYTREQMIAYLLLALLVSSFVLSCPSNDNVGGEVSNGTLNNFLVKPIGYLRYWFTRDLSSKLLNILFAVGEISLLFLLFRPSLSVAPSILSILLLTSAILIYFLLGKLAISVVFWAPEQTWGLMFIILVLVEILTGMIFPLDVLPHWAFSALQFTPFPYLIYFPLISIVGKPVSIRILIQSLIWVAILFYLLKKVWAKGLKTYSAYGG